MTTALCIVDVQPIFSDAKDIVPATVKQIDLAIKRKANIIVVEYAGHDHSYEELYRALDRYDRNKWAVAVKCRDDGSDEIIATMRGNNFEFDRIRMCGVNTCACVLRTACGLKKSNLFSRIDICKEATNCHCFGGNSSLCFENTKASVKKGSWW